jgi:cellulose synthase/poly-beta-1,6-N-acetylglucosamine synthase-like glycosyltransferase
MQIAFWIVLAVLAYAFGGYFLLLKLLAPWVRKVRRPHRMDETFQPRISLVISLHNEEKHIGPRLDNFEALEYPPDKIELVLGDDCSTDRTREIIRKRMKKNPRIKLVEFDTHQGKTEVINKIVPQLTSDIVAFSDANTYWKPESARLLARHFADPRVGAACGHMELLDPAGQNPEDRYWRAEAAMKILENDLGVLLGATGGIYMLRKELFRPLQSNVIQIDDFIWPVRVYEHGQLGVYERDAVATEEVSHTVEGEFRRKVRIGTGDYRALKECWRLLLPWKGWVAFCFWSHKVLRWLAPFFLVALLVVNAFLLDQLLYQVLFALQLAFYASALLGKLLSGQSHFIADLFRVPYYFVGSNLALLLGFFKCVTGRQKAAWSEKAHRTAVVGVPQSSFRPTDRK